MKRTVFVVFLFLASTGAAAGWWKPAPMTTWQWQLTGLPIDQSFEVQAYDIDLFDNAASTIASLHSRGRVVICYFSAGSYENWRPDQAGFPAAVKGNSNGWAGENWLDIRNLAVLGPLMKARLDLAVQKGCDAIEPDNVDGYANNTGFPLTAADQLAYNRFLAVEAHNRGLSIGLKNDLDQVPQLVNDFDWALNEQCNQYKECETLVPFITAGKAVFNTEYSGAPSAFCPAMNSMRISSMKKDLNLTAPMTPCWPPAQVIQSTPAGVNYYVATTGSDSYTAAQAQNPSTPWKTIQKAVSSVSAGATVHVAPGTYSCTGASGRDGAIQGGAS
ncbi:MAG: endo alpha-1,4 polygalactosaminidase, partial [Elusimicrobiales bacterium]